MRADFIDFLFAGAYNTYIYKRIVFYKKMFNLFAFNR